MENRIINIELTAHRFSALLKMEARVHHSEGKKLSGCNAVFCRGCRCTGCDPSNICIYGLMEAFRWQGQYVYYCPAGPAFAAACVTRDGQLDGGITVGPFLMGDSISDNEQSPGRWIMQDDLKKLTRLTSEQTDALGHLLLDAVQTEIIDSNIPRVYTRYEESMHHAQQADIAYKIKGYLNDHFSEKVSLQDIAMYVYFSRTYVSTLFKEETGCGISEYLNAVRIDHACRMLRNTEYTIAEVAQQCGFDDQSYFNRVFKKTLCRSPMQYRKLPTPEKRVNNI